MAVLAALELLAAWRFSLCFFAFGSAATWLLFNLDRPLNVASFIALLVLGVVLGALWQRWHERKATR